MLVAVTEDGLHNGLGGGSQQSAPLVGAAPAAPALLYVSRHDTNNAKKPGPRTQPRTRTHPTATVHFILTRSTLTLNYIHVGLFPTLELLVRVLYM